MPIPNLLEEVKKLQALHPVAWANAHTGSNQTEDFIKLLAQHLHGLDVKFGLNGKRGNPSDLSDDCVNYKGEGPGHDPTDGNRPITVIDVIGAAGSPAAVPTWTVFSELPGPGAWVKPGSSVSAPVPVPPAPAQKPYPGDAFFVEKLGADLAADYAEAKQSLNAGSVVWISRTLWRYVNEGMSIEQSTAQSRKEWRAALGLPPL